MTRRHVRTLAVAFVALAVVAAGSATTVGAAVGVGTTAGVGTTVGVGTTTAAAMAAQSSLDSCTTIDEPGTYVLTASVENGGGTPISQACIEITADDVILYGNGHAIDGRGVSHTKGVAVVNAENVTLTNFTTSDWHAGVLVENGSATVRNVNASSNAYGIRLENASASTVADNAVENNLIGVYADDADVTLDGNDFSDNEISVKRAGDSDERTTDGPTTSPGLVLARA